jgi:hypothetical protein
MHTTVLNKKIKNFSKKMQLFRRLKSCIFNLPLNKNI